MVITFQAQVDPIDTDLNPKAVIFSKEQLGWMKEDLEGLISLLEMVSGEYVRGEMYVDGEVYHG